MAATRSFDDALASGARFLCRAQRDDGRWRDFETLAGPSDEWVTAIALSALAACPAEGAHGSEIGEAVAAGAWWLQAQQRDDGGWGYSALVPSDADSTSHARAALALVPATPPEVLERADRFLTGHVDADGRVHTYADEAGIRAYTGVDETVSFAGWTDAHPCVTAYAASTLLPDQCWTLADALRRWQAADGSWPAYWWADRTAATRWAAEALARAGESEGDAPARARSWLQARGRELLDGPDSPHGMAYPLAHVVAGLLALGSSPASVEPLAEGLLGMQEPDGGWPSSARLRIPPPDVVDPDAVPQWHHGSGGGASINADVRRVVTTATAVGALTSLTSHLTPPLVGR